MSTTTRRDGGSPTLLAVDLGKTGARVRACGPDGVREGEGPGVVGLAAADGVRQVMAALRGALEGLDVGRVDVLAMGLVGYHAASARREALAEALLTEHADLVLLTGDVTTTYVGAIGDRPGVVVAAGTGAVALGADATGRTVVRDGWGFLLGDDGSGYAVGRAGLRAALEHRDGRGGSAALERAATERFGELVGLPAAVHSAAHPSQLIASFATDVARAAQDGDEVARQIWADAAAALARTARACREALDPGLPVCLAGGLAQVGALLAQPFAAAVGGEVLRAAGTSLDGAEALARQAWSGAVSPVVADQVSVVRACGSGLEGAVAEEGGADGLGVPWPRRVGKGRR
ncbi:N-acetylglucosamine kinase [Serinicoccus sp. CUA-874]|uniref:N-acetylglucosamine kinase n=1 Tax=Serinicoccus sp. CUA-874 TaxID=1517939 RepID=UPI0009F9FD7D|nr:BadF/BadG/BcrA/BcrD ATPase family protein [Serinicoccus sp. CUA-874]